MLVTHHEADIVSLVLLVRHRQWGLHPLGATEAETTQRFPYLTSSSEIVSATIRNADSIQVQVWAAAVAHMRLENERREVPGICSRKSVSVGV